MADYTLSAKITGDASGFEKAFSTAERSAASFESKMKSISAKVSAVGDKISGFGAKMTAVTVGLGAATTAGVKYNGTVEQLQTSFEVMTGSADQAADIVDRLKKIGASTPFEFTDLADTTQLLMNFGFTADGAIDSMQMLGDISQGSAEKMNSIARAYGKMSSAGKVSLEDINMMIDAGFNPLQEISESTGESMADLYERISDGAMSVDEITASMQRSTSEGGKYFQSMQKQSQTFNGQMSTLSDNVNGFLGNITGGIFDKLAQDVLPKVNEAISAVNDAFESGGFQGAVDAVKEMNPVLDKVISTAESGAKALQSFGINPAMFAVAVAAAGPLLLILGKIVAVGGSMIGVIGGIAPVIGALASPIGIIVAAIAALAAGFVRLMQTNTEFRDSVTAVWDQVKAKIEGIVSGINFSGITSALGTVVGNIKAMLAQVDFAGIFERLVSSVQSMYAKMSGVFSNLNIPVAAFAAGFIGILAKFGGPIKTFSTKLLSVGTGIAKGIGSAIPKVLPAITGFFSQIKSGGGVLGLLKTGLSGIGGALGGLFSPVTLVVGAIALLVSGFATLMATNEGFRENIISLAQNIVTSLMPVFQMVAQSVGQIVTTVIPVLIDLFNQLLPIIGQIVTVIMQVVAALAPMITQLVGSLLPVITSIISTVMEIISTLMPSLTAILGVVLSAIQAIIPVVTQVLSTAVNVISGILSAVATVAPYIADVVATVIDVIRTIIDHVADIFSRVYETVSDVFSRVVEAVKTAIDTAKNVIENVRDTVSDVFSAVWDTVSSVMERVGNFIGGVFEDIESAWNGLTDFVGGVFDGVGNAVNSLVDSVRGFVNGVIGGINGAVGVINKIPGVSIGYIPYLLHGTDDWQGGFARMNEGGRGELTYLPDGSQVIPHDISVQYAKESARANAAAEPLDMSGLLEGMVIQIVNNTSVDGTPLKEAASDYTIRKINRTQYAARRTKGAFA